jgi:4'-phosphopantetheinyl transferase
VSLSSNESTKLPLRKAPDNLDLAADDVHVWLARSVDIRNVVVSCANLLSAPEQARAEKFRFARDRELFVAAHVALRSILPRSLKQSATEIGVDVELIKQVFAFDEIAERFFTAREVAALRALPSRVRCQGFFKCWTSKEAFLKAKGTALSGKLD